MGQPGPGLNIFLLSHLDDFPMAIGMHVATKSGTTSRSILWKKPTGLEPDSTSIAERLGPERPGSPLRGLLDLAMAASPLELRTGLNRGLSLLLLPLRFTRGFHKLDRVREDETGRGKPERRRGTRTRRGRRRGRRIAELTQRRRPSRRSSPFCPGLDRDRGKTRRQARSTPVRLRFIPVRGSWLGSLLGKRV